MTKEKSYQSYKKPRLKTFGDMSTLTAAGSGASAEGAGTDPTRKV